MPLFLTYRCICDLIPFELNYHGGLWRVLLRNIHEVGIARAARKLLYLLHEINPSCTEQLDRIVSQMTEPEYVTEALKAADQMEWVCRMNAYQRRGRFLFPYEFILAFAEAGNRFNQSGRLHFIDKLTCGRYCYFEDSSNLGTTKNTFHAEVVKK